MVIKKAGREIHENSVEFCNYSPCLTLVKEKKKTVKRSLSVFGFEYSVKNYQKCA